MLLKCVVFLGSSSLKTLAIRRMYFIVIFKAIVSFVRIEKNTFILRVRER